MFMDDTPEFGFETDEDLSLAFPELLSDYTNTTDSLTLAVEARPLSPELVKDEAKTVSTPGTCSRYGRARAVPNFARMIDPLSNRSSSHSSPSARSNGPGHDDHGPKSYSGLVDKVHELIGKIGVTVLATTGENGGVHTEKFIGVRPKQAQFAAVIKKNHSEIHLGVFPTAAEAARAYDMAALLSQGDRAKVNFADSVELFCVHTGIEGRMSVPSVERSRCSDTQATALTTAPLPAHGQATMISDAAEAASTPAAPPPEPAFKIFGEMLDNLANRLPYAAVKSSALMDWEDFYSKNECLRQVLDLSRQLIWLSSQVVNEALLPTWADRRQDWDTACANIQSVDEATTLTNQFETEALDWNHINALWEAQEVEEAQKASTDGRDGMDSGLDSSLPSSSPVGEDGSHISGIKRKFFEGDDIHRVPCVSQFVDMNMHVLDESEASPRTREARPVKVSPGINRTGIEPSLELIRQTRVSRQSSMLAKREYGKHALQLFKSKLSGGLKMKTVENRILESKMRPVASTIGLSRGYKGRGLRCRYCGKEFTHPPAHLQHERAHLQQRDDTAPRLFLGPSASKLYQKRLHGVEDSDGAASSVHSAGAASSAASSSQNEEVSEACKDIVALAQRLPVCVWKEHNAARWEAFEKAVRSCSSLDDVTRQLVWLSNQLDPRVLQIGWQSKSGDAAGEELASWQSQCGVCATRGGMAELIQMLEKRALDSHAISRISASDASRLGPQECPLAVPATVGGILIPGEGEGEWEVTESPAAATPAPSGAGSVELSLPCSVCQAQTKGIAACFAQGHLFVTPQGEEPTSCKDCKLRNKGALFCFKRGHMPYLVPSTAYAAGIAGCATSLCESPAEPRILPPG